MKKPVKKAVTPARKKVVTPARAASRSKRKAPGRAAKFAAPPRKARPLAFVIPPILLETAPPPLVPRMPESKPVESQIILQQEVAENQNSPAVISLLPSATNVFFESAAIIPSLVQAPITPTRMEPEIPTMAPDVAVSAAHEPERGILRLLARDPHCLFATWDFSRASLESHRQHSFDGCLHLKVHAEGQGEEQDVQDVQDVLLTPEACEWFLSVQRGGTEYRVEMGYRNRAGAWVSMADPAVATTPAEVPSAPATAQMRTVVFPVLDDTAAAVLSAGPVMEPAPRVQRYPAAEITVASDLPWIPEVQAALAALSAPQQKAKTPVAANSLQLHMAELERGVPGPAQGPEAVPPPGGLPSSIPGVFSLPTSFLPAQQVQPESIPARNFWFTVNAELIIYGATEPDAQVEIGGHPVRLRPDGGFSFRFALPDGQFELPVVAASADGVDCRGAVLRFARCTQTVGVVGVHPQDPELKKPLAESCA
jgi:uncharacterized protein